jgi:DivIVA domain-containing protein
MPDQSSAASEHAIMQEITQPLSDLPQDPVAAVASVDFPLVLRGYDRDAVDEYVRRTTQLVAELYATRSPEGAVRRALERVGEQVSAILSRAHDTAEGITSQSRAEAEERLVRAREEADELQTGAERRAQERERAAQVRVQALDAEVDRIWGERDRIVADVRRLSEQLEEIAGVAATRFPAATTEESVAIAGPEGIGAQDALEDAEVDSRPGDAEVDSPIAGAEESPDVEMPEPPEAADEFEGEEFSAQEEEYPSEQPEIDLHHVPAELSEDPVTPIEPEPVAGGVLPVPPPFIVPEALGDPGAGELEQPTRVFQRPRMRVIDLHHLGLERVIGCWQVGDVLIDPGPASCLETLLAALPEPPRALLLTHIHLDHAGAAGALVRKWPELEVYVHASGAPHLIDPSRLLESARRLYGGNLERLWGEVAPVPEANLRVLNGGERVLGDRFEVAYTPGHASHHVSFLHERTAFVGDVGGVRITPEPLTIAPTPPPDIDIEAWNDSIQRVLSWEPAQIAMTHFGLSDNVEEQLSELAARLDTWAALVRTEELESFVEIVEAEIERGSAPEHRAAYKQAAPPEQIYAGLTRYWQKRDEEASTAEVPAADTPDERRLGSAAEASTHAGRAAAQTEHWTPGAE